MSIKITDLAKELDYPAKKMTEFIESLGMGKLHWLKSVTDEEADMIRRNIQSVKEEDEVELDKNKRFAYSVIKKSNGRFCPIKLQFDTARPNQVLETSLHTEDYRFKSEAFMSMLSLFDNDENFFLEE